MKVSRHIKLGFIAAAAALTQACAISIPVDSPVASQMAYEQDIDSSPINISLVNELKADHKISEGTLQFEFKQKKQPLDADNFIFENLENELKARNSSNTISDDANISLILKDFEIYNYRANAFTPLVTLTTAKTDLVTESGTQRISALVKRAKVPIWAINEEALVEPCFNEPTEILIKELAAKINRATGKASLSDDTIEQLYKKIINNPDAPLAYMDVYELGFSNNPNAIPLLEELVKNDAEYTRLAAISSLGTIGATDKINLLQNIYNSDSSWSDRGMALKSIGDLNTAESQKILKDAKIKWKRNKSKEEIWNNLIIDLYID